MDNEEEEGISNDGEKVSQNSRITTDEDENKSHGGSITSENDGDSESLAESGESGEFSKSGSGKKNVENVVNLLLLGKPGIGKSTIAKKLASILNSIYVHPKVVIEEYKNRDSSIGIDVQGILNNGGTIDIRDSIALLKEKIQTDTEVIERGYVLDGLPDFECDPITDIPVKGQLEILQNLSNQPSFIFCFHMQDADLKTRRLNQRFDYKTGIIYGVHDYSPGDVTEEELALITKHPAASEMSIHGHLLPPIETEETTPDSPFEKETCFRLFSRTEDTQELIQRDLELYSENRGVLQTFLQSFDPKIVFEINAYWSPNKIIQSILEIIKDSENPFEVSDQSEIDQSETEEKPDLDFGMAKNLDLSSLSPSGYLLASGLSKEIEDLLLLMATKRPRLPFMSSKKCAQLYMAYYLKCTINPRLDKAERDKYKQAMDTFDYNQNEQNKEIFQKLRDQLSQPPAAGEFMTKIDEFLRLEFMSESERLPIST